MPDDELKPVNWVGDTLEVLRKFPEAARREFGFALLQAQRGGRAINATPLVCFKGASVLEIRVNDTGETYRTIYTAKFSDAIYVLHAFQKKSSSGAKMRKSDMQLIERRFYAVELKYRALKRAKTRRDQNYGKGA